MEYRSVNKTCKKTKENLKELWETLKSLELHWKKMIQLKICLKKKTFC